MFYVNLNITIIDMTVNKSDTNIQKTNLLQTDNSNRSVATNQTILEKEVSC